MKFSLIAIATFLMLLLACAFVAAPTAVTLNTAMNKVGTALASAGK